MRSGLRPQLSWGRAPPTALIIVSTPRPAPITTISSSSRETGAKIGSEHAGTLCYIEYQAKRLAEISIRRICPIEAQP